MKKRKVTYEIVREFLDYYPGTGILIWKSQERSRPPSIARAKTYINFERKLEKLI